MAPLTQLCRKSDDEGDFNPRCQHIIRHPQNKIEPRQCLRAAMRGDRFCGTPGHNDEDHRHPGRRIARRPPQHPERL